MNSTSIAFADYKCKVFVPLGWLSVLCRTAHSAQLTQSQTNPLSQYLVVLVFGAPSSLHNVFCTIYSTVAESKRSIFSFLVYVLS